MKDKKSIKIVVIGGVHHNTLGVVRSLGEEKIKKENLVLFLVGSKKKKNIVSSSKYLKKANIRYFDDNSQIIGELYNLASDGIKRVVICCSDGSAEVVIKNFDNLKHSFWCPSTTMDISQLMQKEVQGQIATASGFNIPRSEKISKNNFKHWNIFPCIIKPLKSSVSGGKSNIKILKDMNELSEALQEAKYNEFQVQQFLQKKMEYQLIGCSLDSGNKVFIPGYTNIIRQPENTNTGYLKYSPIAELQYDENAVSRFLKTIGYNGLFSLEFIRGKDGKDYFLEINLRNDGNAYCVKSAGVNLPFLWCFYNYYGEMPIMNYSFKKTIYFMPEFSDFVRGVKCVGFLTWVKQFVFAKSHAIFNLKDMKPFFRKCISIKKF